jgi:hypothetical protein
LEVLRRMTPEQKFKKVYEVTAMSRQLFRLGLRQRFPELSEEELHELYLRKLAECHNQNY